LFFDRRCRHRRKSRREQTAAPTFIPLALKPLLGQVLPNQNA
jgi:hypothetical protein